MDTINTNSSDFVDVGVTRYQIVGTSTSTSTSTNFVDADYHHHYQHHDPIVVGMNSHDNLIAIAGCANHDDDAVTFTAIADPTTTSSSSSSNTLTTTASTPTTTTTTTTMGELHTDDGVEDVVMMNNGNSNFIDCLQRPSASSSSSTAAVGMTEGRREEGTVNTNSSKLNNKRRKVSFRDGVATTDVYEIPSIADAYQLECPEIFNLLFYNDTDYARFRCAEQKRYDKMIAKKIQRLVREKMKQQIEEALQRNVAPDEIEKMMPQSYAEIVNILGSDIMSAVTTHTIGMKTNNK